jgi:hypothetical protein
MSSPARWPKAMRLGQALHQAGDADLVDHLGQLARARWRRAACTARAEAMATRLGRWSKAAGVAAAHHGEQAVLGARLAARHRRVDEVQARALGRGVQLARDVGRGGGVVDEDGAGLHAGEGAVGAQRDAAQVIVVADAGRTRCRRPRRPRAGVAASRAADIRATQASALAAVRL